MSTLEGMRAWLLLSKKGDAEDKGRTAVLDFAGSSIIVERWNFTVWRLVFLASIYLLKIGPPFFLFAPNFQAEIFSGVRPLAATTHPHYLALSSLHPFSLTTPNDIASMHL
jgi:hypothetical protein